MGQAAVKKKSFKPCEIRELMMTLTISEEVHTASELRASLSSFIFQAQKLQSNNERVTQMLFSSFGPQPDSQTSSVQ